MFLSLLTFVLVVYGLCFLAADARIFGADTLAWNEVYDDPRDGELEWLQQLGEIRVRQKLLPIKFFREHLSCYFCMGVWAGPLAHVLFWNFYVKNDYFLSHPSTIKHWVIGLVLSFLVGGSASFLLNAVLLDLKGDE